VEEGHGSEGGSYLGGVAGWGMGWVAVGLSMSSKDDV